MNWEGTDTQTMALDAAMAAAPGRVICRTAQQETAWVKR